MSLQNFFHILKVDRLANENQTYAIHLFVLINTYPNKFHTHDCYTQVLRALFELFKSKDITNVKTRPVFARV